MSKSEIEVKRYNWETKAEEDVCTLSVYNLVRSINSEQLAYLLSEYLNIGMKDGFTQGKNVGKIECGDHRTMQGEVIRFALGVIVGLSKQEHTDGRNEEPVKMCQKIAKMVEDGELKMGWMI